MGVVHDQGELICPRELAAQEITVKSCTVVEKQRPIGINPGVRFERQTRLADPTRPNDLDRDVGFHEGNERVKLSRTPNERLRSACVGLPSGELGGMHCDGQLWDRETKKLLAERQQVCAEKAHRQELDVDDL
jgi:hypothetical protein